MHGFRFMASWRLEKILSVQFERQHRMLDFWTMITWLAGKFQVSNETSQIYSASFFLTFWTSVTAVVQTVDIRYKL
jgi:hypothetical protein